MKKALIIGGTRFFGKRLVEQLIREQVEVTILTRGRAADPFGDDVVRLTADRTDREALRAAIGSNTYDVVYDNVCYTPQEAAAAVELFRGRVGKYVVTSSQSVYDFAEGLKESVVDPYAYAIPQPYPDKPDYAEGKRLVEAVFVQQADFPVTAVRFPIVLGHDDYTRRLHFHIEHVQQSLPIGMSNPEAHISFIRSDDAAAFLAWLGRSELSGPVNACSHGDIELKRLMALIGEATGKQPDIQPNAEDEHMSPFGIPHSWIVDLSKATEAGYRFLDLDDWLPPLIREIAG